MNKHEPVQIDMTRAQLGSVGPRIAVASLVLGVLGLIVAIILGRSMHDGMKHFWFSYHVNFCYFLSIALGALFFVLLYHQVRFDAGVVTRRLMETAAVMVFPMAVLALPMLLNVHTLFQWSHASLLKSEEMLRYKLPYLNEPFFYIRVVVYFLCFMLFSAMFLSRSVAQDREDGTHLTFQMRFLSAGAMVCYATCVTFLAFDFVKSLDFKWHSDVFGVYFWAGSCIGGMAFVTVSAMALQATGRLNGIINTEHYHDLGKFLFGFVFFWAYVGFGQYMLIWYTNLPEETHWYLWRQTGTWVVVELIILFGAFLLPFLGLLVNFAKRSRPALGFWAVWLLAMHWVDMYWMIAPQMRLTHVPLNFIDPACFVGIGGLFVAAYATLSGAFPLVPVKDPKLGVSLTFENNP